jgi:hypothetical protein
MNISWRRQVRATLWLALVCPSALWAAGLTFQSLDHPNARATIPTCIDARGIAGTYWHVSLYWRGFYWDESGFKPVGNTNGTQVSPSATSGGNVVGRYQFQVGGEGDVMRSFFWDGATSIDLIPPGSVRDVYAVGISGNLVVGHYRDAAAYVHGFLWDGSTYTRFDVPGSPGTWPRAISGTHVAGDYVEVQAGTSAGITRGFFWDGATFTLLNHPGSKGTWVTGLHGADVVGTYTYQYAGVGHGFLWNGSTFGTIDPPGSTYTQPTAVFGGRVVGHFSDGTLPVGTPQHGFLWDGTGYTTLDVPGAIWTQPSGLWEDRIIGQYQDAEGKLRGFVTVIPERAVLVSLGSTNMFAGSPGRVPLRLTTTAALTNLSVMLECSSARLTSLTLQPAAAEVLAAELTPLAPNQFRLNVHLDPAAAGTGERTLAQLAFQTTATGNSAVVPLLLGGPAGKLANGGEIGHAQASSGRVVLVDGAPVLTVGDPPWMSVVLYGYPDVSYRLQTTTNLNEPAWQTVTNVTLSGPFVPIGGLGLDAPAAYYRALGN